MYTGRRLQSQMTEESDEKLVIVGAGGHARSVIDVAEALGKQIEGVIDLNFHNQDENIFGHPVLGGLEWLTSANSRREIIIAIGDCQRRAEIFEMLNTKSFLISSLVHPSATVSPHASIGKGTLVNVGAIVNAGSKIGMNCIINTGGIIEHEVVVGSHSHIGPGASVAGRVRIGSKVFVGIGARIIDSVVIGDWVTIGAGSIIINDVPATATIAGIPGKIIKLNL